MVKKPKYQKDIEELLKKMAEEVKIAPATNALDKLIEATIVEAEKLLKELGPCLESLEGLTLEDKLALLPLLRVLWDAEGETPFKLFRVFSLGRAFERRKIK